MIPTRAALLILPLLLTTSALAQDLDLLDGDDDTTTDDKRLKEGDSIENLDEENALEGIDDHATLDGGDLLGEEGSAPTSSDSAAIYRAQLDSVKELEPDEEIMSWESYLEEYPDSTFRERIVRRMDDLTESLYGRQTRPGETSGGNADDQRIDLSQALLLENMDPRTRVQAGFEWGLPDYANLILDYEQSLQPALSVHGGVRHRYTGWSLEGGVKYAVLRSVRTRSLVTLLGDFRANTDPAFLAFRPQIAAGHRFEKVDIQAQFGADLSLRKQLVAEATNASRPELRWVGGFNVTYAASDAVSIFAEGNLQAKHAGDFGYRFNMVTFGLKFYPNVGGSGRMEANVGASAPVDTNYWMYHFGSIMGQANYYLD